MKETNILKNINVKFYKLIKKYALNNSKLINNQVITF